MKYNNEVDYTKIVLSGTEGDRHFNTAVDFAKCNHMLVSYLYLGNKGTSWFDARIKKMGSGGSYMVDSGAHSFNKDGYCPAWPDLAWFEDYVLRYANFIKANKDVIDLCANLDSDAVVGMAKMEEWDQQVFGPLEDMGIPVCYVWHPQYGFDYWVDMCRKHKNVGLPGNLSVPEMHKHFKVAMMNGCRVHGFAATKGSILGKIPFASTDSITWKSGEMYGQTFLWENSKLRVMDKSQKSDRAKYKAKWVAAGVDWALLEQDKASEITKVCALAWGEYIEHIKQHSKKLAYWVKPLRLIQKAVPDIDTATLEDIGALYDELEFEIPVTGLSQAKIDLKEILAFVDRDTEKVSSIDDEGLDKWLDKLKIVPENTSRGEKEASIRQELYKYFYKIAPDKVLARDSDDSLDPLYELTLRLEELQDAPTVRGDLPTINDTSCAGIIFNSEENNQNEELLQDPTVTANIKVSTVESATLEKLQDLIDKELTEVVTSRMHRVKAMLLVELLFEQLKLKAQSQELKDRKKQVRKQRTLRSQAAAMADSISEAAEALDEELHLSCIDKAERLLKEWKLVGALAESLPPAKTKRGHNLTPEKAREIGRKGGAPLGNQNARKHGLTSTKMPNLACDHCPHVQVCPQYKEGHVCAYTKEFHSPIIVDKDSNPQKEAVRLILEKQVERLRKALLFETLEGGIPNKSVDKIMDSVVKAASILDRMDNPIPVGPTMLGVVPSPPASPDQQAPAKGFLGSLFGEIKEASVEQHGD